jgi:chaperonin cofactor prefoldin
MPAVAGAGTDVSQQLARQAAEITAYKAAAAAQTAAMQRVEEELEALKRAGSAGTGAGTPLGEAGLASSSTSAAASVPLTGDVLTFARRVGAKLDGLLAEKEELMDQLGKLTEEVEALRGAAAAAAAKVEAVQATAAQLSAVNADLLVRLGAKAAEVVIANAAAAEAQVRRLSGRVGDHRQY